MVDDSTIHSGSLALSVETADAPDIEDGETATVRTPDGAMKSLSPSVAADPFAVDLFAMPHVGEAEEVEEYDEGFALEDDLQAADDFDSEINGTPTRIRWHTRLPRISIEQVRLARLTSALHSSLANTARRSLALALDSLVGAQASVQLDCLDVREVELGATFNHPDEDAAPCLFIHLAMEPTVARFALKLQTSFAHALIDRVLGGDGAEGESLAPLSKIEQAVVEFVCLYLVRELNAAVGERVWRIERVANEPPEWLASRRSDDAKNKQDDRDKSEDEFLFGLTLAARVRIPPATADGIATSGIVRFYLPARAVAAFNEKQNPLLFAQASVDVRAKNEQLKEFAADARARVMLGETTLSATDLAGLDKGDCVVVEQASVARRHGGITGGHVRILFGDGGNVRVSGELMNLNTEAQRAENLGEETSLLALRIETIESTRDATDAKERLVMEESSRMNTVEEATDAADGSGGEETPSEALSFEALLLTLHVELAARRVSLDELVNMRPDQIIELGCAATDPVDLTVDNRPVARGELVDIEGRLGVRITQILR